MTGPGLTGQTVPITMVDLFRVSVGDISMDSGMAKFTRGCCLVLLIMLSTSSFADADDIPAAVSRTLTHILPGEHEAKVSPAVVEGFFEVGYGGEVFYVSADGRYMLRGDLLDLKTMKNLSEERRSAYRRGLLAEIDPAGAITFAPEKTPARHVVYIFTDIDCPYCRKMHQQIADYNRLGIEIRYLAYPRSGVGTPSYYKAISVWCAKDRKAALTRAKLGETLPRETCDNPVDGHMALADRFGVDGTPTLILEDGSVVPGYVEPARLVAFLDQRGL